MDTAQGQRRYTWDALGRLTQVSQGDHAELLLARYAYDHRGLRTTKTVSGSGSANTTTHTLYNESRQPLAELNAQGRITRQYIWLADMLLAVMDSDSGLTPASAAHTADGQPLAQEVPLSQDLWALLVSWGQVIGSAVTDQPWQLTFIHTNHLGAPELATNAQGQPVWAADYAPFGGATVRGFVHTGSRTGQSNTFVLNLRLPGQMFDAETGLHDNRQRYYDPATGQYLTPDPLGQPDGPNAYLYAAGNPLSFIDPDGLVLFAFDGTDNSDNPEWLRAQNSSLTNVVRFRDAYDITNGPARYVTGVGTDHAGRDNYGNIISRTYDSGLIPDKGGNYSGPDRIARMNLYFNDEAERIQNDNEIMQVDIVGFSRGAAQAREFANRLVVATRNGWYRYQAHARDGSLQVDAAGKPVMRCQRVEFRFMGLFDTVLSTNRSGTAYNMAVPSQFAYVAQAVALNEYRSAPAGTDAFWTAPTNLRFWDDTRPHLPGDNHYGGFPLQSIGASSSTVGQVRIERGFIGAHADIGGGYAATENGLSTVALSWMVAQAQIAGVKMNTDEVPAIDMASPVIHDQSNLMRFGNPSTAPATFAVRGALWGTNTRNIEDRQVLGGLGGATQRTQTFGPAEAGGNRSMANADTHEFISYWERDPQLAGRAPTNEIVDIVNLRNRTGSVDMQGYMNWLRKHGYVFAKDD